MPREARRIPYPRRGITSKWLALRAAPSRKVFRPGWVAPGRAGYRLRVRCIPMGQALRIPGAGTAMAWRWLALRAAPPIGGAARKASHLHAIALPAPGMRRACPIGMQRTRNLEPARPGAPPQSLKNFQDGGHHYGGCGYSAATNI